jgi:sortase (surface protein transpeptidase)
VPVSLDVPRIGIHNANLVHLGLGKDGSIQVPPVGANSPAGWFRNSPTPGQLGPSVILGHVDSATAGPAIFYRLGTLRPGDVASITRADHTVAVFRVDSVEEYAKSAFPTLQVFGSTDHAALRLITCGGKFNPAKASYESNVVVYAHLASSHRA